MTSLIVFCSWYLEKQQISDHSRETGKNNFQIRPQSFFPFGELIRGARINICVDNVYYLLTGNAFERYFEVWFEVFRTRLRNGVDGGDQQRTFGVAWADGVDVSRHITVTSEGVRVVRCNATAGSQSAVDSSPNKNDLIWSGITVKIHAFGRTVLF